jgi:hypothetical protein
VADKDCRSSVGRGAHGGGGPGAARGGRDGAGWLCGGKGNGGREGSDCGSASPAPLLGNWDGGGEQAMEREVETQMREGAIDQRIR